MGRPGRARLAGGGGRQFQRSYLAAKLDVIAQNLRHIPAKTFLLVGFQLVGELFFGKHVNSKTRDICAKFMTYWSQFSLELV